MNPPQRIGVSFRNDDESVWETIKSQPKVKVSQRVAFADFILLELVAEDFTFDLGNFVRSIDPSYNKPIQDFSGISTEDLIKELERRTGEQS